MTVIKAQISVADDHSISGTAPSGVPPGEHAVAITVAPVAAPRQPGKPFTMEGFLIDDGPWDDSISLRREDMYGDDGR